MMKNVGIIGFGWLGSKIANTFQDFAHIFPTTTTKEKYKILLKENYNPTLIHFSEEINDIMVWDKCELLDAIIISVPFSTKVTSVDSVRNKTKNLIQFLGDFDKQIILLSSTGVYPKDLKTYFEKDLDPLDVLTERYFKERFPEVNILRLGGLMGIERRLSNYQNLKDLDSKVNHVHHEDVSNIIKMLILGSAKNEILNIVAPNHPTKREIIEYQKNKNIISDLVQEKQRIISSEKLSSKYNYSFIHPNPIYF